jgi:hypothetical protein
MKNLFTLLAVVLFTANVFAQSPGRMSYQAVVRDSAGDLVQSLPVGMQISILQGSIGPSVFTETHAASTNINGLVSIEIGGGTVTYGDFDTIHWENGPYFIKTETDPLGGVVYTITGVSQLLSVPYALYAKTSGTPHAYSGNCGYSIGQNVPALGGIIFYLDPSGCHGLVCPTTDQSTGIQWTSMSINTTAFASSVGGGDENTTSIFSSCGSNGFAAVLCYNLSTGGYTDWYLPSKYELNLMYMNIGQGNLFGLGNIGGFANNYYWSSTDATDNNAWAQDFSSGLQAGWDMSIIYHVRAVRAF